MTARLLESVTTRHLSEGEVLEIKANVGHVKILEILGCAPEHDVKECFLCRAKVEEKEYFILVVKITRETREKTFLNLIQNNPLTSDVTIPTLVFSKGLIMPKAKMAMEYFNEIKFEADYENKWLEAMKHIIDPIVKLEVVRILHRDLKPDNIVVYDGNWRLIDFDSSCFDYWTPGNSEITKSSHVFSENVANRTTWHYACPGLLVHLLDKGEKALTVRPDLGYKRDVWSFGITASILYTRFIPCISDILRFACKEVLEWYTEIVPPKEPIIVQTLVSRGVSPALELPPNFFRLIQKHKWLKRSLEWYCDKRPSAIELKGLMCQKEFSPRMLLLRPYHHMLEMPKISLEKRLCAFDFLFKFTLDNKLDIGTWFLALDLFDRYWIKKAQQEDDKKKEELNLNTLSLACIYLANQSTVDNEKDEYEWIMPDGVSHKDLKPWIVTLTEVLKYGFWSLTVFTAWFTTIRAR